MKFTLEIELDNGSMRTSYDVRRAILASMTGIAAKDVLIPSADNVIRDINLNVVGQWQVEATNRLLRSLRSLRRRLRGTL